MDLLDAGPAGRGWSGVYGRRTGAGLGRGAVCQLREVRHFKRPSLRFALSGVDAGLLRVPAVGLRQRLGHLLLREGPLDAFLAPVRYRGLPASDGARGLSVDADVRSTGRTAVAGGSRRRRPRGRTRQEFFAAVAATTRREDDPARPLPVAAMTGRLARIIHKPLWTIRTRPRNIGTNERIGSRSPAESADITCRDLPGGRDT